jgi:hypothetical protein
MHKVQDSVPSSEKKKRRREKLKTIIPTFLGPPVYFYTAGWLA